MKTINSREIQKITSDYYEVIEKQRKNKLLVTAYEDGIMIK